MSSDLLQLRRQRPQPNERPEGLRDVADSVMVHVQRCEQLEVRNVLRNVFEVIVAHVQKLAVALAENL